MTDEREIRGVEEKVRVEVLQGMLAMLREMGLDDDGFAEPMFCVRVGYLGILL